MVMIANRSLGLWLVAVVTYLLLLLLLLPRIVESKYQFFL